MSDRDNLTRRLLLGNTLAASTLLAGCSGNGGATETQEPETATETATETPTETETETETDTPTEEPTTVENFAYPSGANQDGIMSSELYTTHRSSIIDAGSATVTVTQSTDRGDFTSSTNLTNTYSTDGLLRIAEESDLTERLWSPTSENVGYVEMDTGFDQRYRIDNQAPPAERVLRLQIVENILAGGQWSGATEIVETTDGDPAVVYESSGIASEENLTRVLFNETITGFEATIAVTENGHISSLSYDITGEQGSETRQQQAETIVKELGETTVNEPSWATTAKEDGVRFNATISDDRRAVLLELVNGNVPSEARINLSSDRFGSVTLSQALGAGDTIHTSFSESGEALVAIDERPSGATEFGDFVFVNLRSGQFTLFDNRIR